MGSGHRAALAVWYLALVLRAGGGGLDCKRAPEEVAGLGLDCLACV